MHPFLNIYLHYEFAYLTHPPPPPEKYPARENLFFHQRKSQATIRIF